MSKKKIASPSRNRPVATLVTPLTITRAQLIASLAAHVKPQAYHGLLGLNTAALRALLVYSESSAEEKADGNVPFSF